MTSADFRDMLLESATRASIPIDEALASRLEAYFRLLARWNVKINLTGFSLEPLTKQAMDRLFIEPLRIGSVLSHPERWFDLGSGGGSPAIPLQLYKPARELVLIESRERKAAFLREVVRELGLKGVLVEVMRLEEVNSSHLFAMSADLVTLRAVRPSPAVFGAIAALLRRGGRALLIGFRPSQAVQVDGLQVVPAFGFAVDDAVTMLERT